MSLIMHFIFLSIQFLFLKNKFNKNDGFIGVRLYAQCTLHTAHSILHNVQSSLYYYYYYNLKMANVISTKNRFEKLCIILCGVSVHLSAVRILYFNRKDFFLQNDDNAEMVMTFIKSHLLYIQM